MSGAGRGRFITFEGIDGAGKSTQILALAHALAGRGVALLQTREPGGTALGESLRALLLERGMQPLTETLLMFAARAEHVRAIIAPALQSGQWVLCDRFTDASYAYQGAGKGVARAQLDALAQWVHADLVPDLTVLVDVDPALAAQRRAAARAADRFEAESLEFFARVRAGYLERAAGARPRFLVVEGADAPATIAARILARVEPWLA